MRIEFLTPDSERWQGFLSGVPHDFYHLPGYVRLAAAQEGGQPEAVLMSEGDDYFFVPYVIRPLSNLPWLRDTAAGLHDLISPYGYPCPLLCERRPPFLAAAITCWAHEMRERQIVSGFIRLHPLFEERLDALTPFGLVLPRGPTVAMDLSGETDEIWRQMRSNHQRDIKRARKLGLRVTMDHGPDSLRHFQAIYRESMDRVGAVEAYYFSSEYFDELSQVLGDSLCVCLAWTPAGAAVAGLLLVECGPIVQYHLGGTRTTALTSAPAKLLFDHAWRWARERGRRVFHLGGGVGGAEDSLFNFKSGFSDRRHEFRNWQLVFLAEAYQRLEARRREYGPAECRPNFFPSYRA